MPAFLTRDLHSFIAGKDLLPTELQYSDGFAQLAVHLMLDVNDEKGIHSMESVGNFDSMRETGSMFCQNFTMRLFWVIDFHPVSCPIP